MEYTYSIVIPTKRSIDKLKPLLQSIQKQTFLPERIILLLDLEITQKDLDEYRHNISQVISGNIFSKLDLITTITHSFLFHRGVSYVRNFGIGLVQTPLVLCIDDDNAFIDTFCENMINTWIAIKHETDRDSVLIPTEFYKGRIRSRGYTKFRYRLGGQKPLQTNTNKIKTKKIRDISTYHIIKEKLFGLKAIQINNQRLLPIQFSSANCILGPKHLFHGVPFDERMQFAYEDFDFTRRITILNYPMFVMLDTSIDHQMRAKNKLEESYMADESGYGIFEKSKNRVLFVKNTGKLHNKIDYFLLGLWIHTTFLLYKIIRYAPLSEKYKLIKNMFKGTLYGIFK